MVRGSPSLAFTLTDSTPDLINIITVIVFGVEHRFDDGYTYGQSFWLTVCSTVASSVTNVSVIVDYALTADFARSGEPFCNTGHHLLIEQLQAVASRESSVHWLSSSSCYWFISRLEHSLTPFC